MVITISLTDLDYSSYVDLLLVYKCYNSFTYLSILLLMRFTYCLSHIMVIIMILSLHLRSDYASSIA